QIFRTIETNSFCPTDFEHLFLIAYRAVLRELHVAMEAVSKTQSGYLKRVELGLDSRDEPGPAGMFAVEHIMKAYLMYLYKNRFDEAYLARQYDRILHDVIKINHLGPTVAVSSLFSVDGISRENDWVRATLNIFPIDENESLAVFSYLPDGAVLARSAL